MIQFLADASCDFSAFSLPGEAKAGDDICPVKPLGIIGRYFGEKPLFSVEAGFQRGGADVDGNTKHRESSVICNGNGTGRCHLGNILVIPKGHTAITFYADAAGGIIFGNIFADKGIIQKKRTAERNCAFAAFSVSPARHANRAAVGREYFA